jgi:hypothetical protein
MSESRQHDDPAFEAALLAKVRKLMEKAAATANPHEADAFSRKAAELIARHRLDPEHLTATAGHGELVVREIPLGRGAYVRARLALLMAVATSQDARVVFGTTPTGTVAYVAGFAAELDLVGVMYHSLHEQAATQMASIRRSTAAATQRFRRSFLFGYADRMGQLLADTRSDAEAAASVAPSSSVAVALRERGERIDEFASRTFGRVRTARSPSAAQAGGWKAGASAADRADVGRARLAGRKALGRST